MILKQGCMRSILNRLFWIACINLIFCACNRKSEDTQVFEKYLQASFGKRIDSKAQYIIVSSTACGSCAEYVYQLAREQSTPFIFIFPRYYKKKFDTIPPKVLIDTTMRIEKLALHQRKIAKVTVDDGKVSKIIVYDPGNIEKIAD